MIHYRELQSDEAQLLASIDRSEHIDGFYRATGGFLELVDASEDVPTWSGAELDDNVHRLEALIELGGIAYSAWDGNELVGIGTLATCRRGRDLPLMKLDMLYVSTEHRGRGIGRELTEMVAERAFGLGATALYISATPTRRTVDAYLRMGAEVLAVPDPELLALEPEDVHLALRLR